MKGSAIAGLRLPGTGPWPLPDLSATGAKPPQAYPNSICTTPIPMSFVQHPASATLVNNLITSNGGSGASPFYGKGVSRYVVKGNSCPKITLYVNPPQQGVSGPIGVLSVPFPKPSLLLDMIWSTDHTLIIWDTDAQLLYNIWRLSSSLYSYPDSQRMKDTLGNLIPNQDGSWTCATIQITPTDGSYPGVGRWANDPTGLSSTSSASGIPFEAENHHLADLMYVQAGGAIEHFMAAGVQNTGFGVWPAIGYDFSYVAASVGEGLLFTWAPGTVKPSGQGVIASAFWDQIANFGLFISDFDGGVTSVSAENYLPWNIYAPGGNYQSYLAGLLNWGTNEDNQGRPLFPSSWNWSDLVVVTPRTANGWIGNTALPSAPQGVGIATGGSGSHQFTLSWSAPASWGGGTSEGYYVFVGTSSGNYQPSGYNGSINQGAGLMNVTTSTTSYTINHDTFDAAFASGTRYFFVVCACSSAGMGTASIEVSAVAP